MSKLKICLSMGGGVSLGAFSGAALTEALKLLVLYGRDKEGKEYDEVILDGMSGASAGSISLTILIRCLIDCKSIINKDFFLNYIKSDKDNVIAALEDRLNNTYSDAALNENIKAKMLALEVAQLMQEIIWVKEIDTAKLFKRDDFNPVKPFGLLNRNAIINLAKDYFIEAANEIDINNKQLLGDRVLMAFSMANMSPMAYGEKNTNLNPDDIPSLVRAFQAATNTNNHNELRVFNFLFKDINSNRTDSRYITITPDGSVNKLKNTKSLTTAETWSIITASAVASGAFPIGFAPVVLERYKYEYSEKEWKPNDKGIDKMNFAYVDGGTFNNEPIKEAFKIGYYNDFEDSYIGDRLILFVDPSVPGEVKVQQLQSLDPLKNLKKKKIFNYFENNFKGDNSKASAIVSDLISMVHNQSKINEEAKIAKFYTNVLFKNTFIKYLENIKEIDIEQLFNSQLLESTCNVLEETLEDRQISIGTRDVWELIWKRYKDRCNISNTLICLSEDRFKELYGLFKERNGDEHTKNKIDELLKECSYEDKVRIATSFLITITEAALNQSGKSEQAERAGIFPITGSDKDQYIIEDLPGSQFAAFGGFASLSARKACFMKARLDAIICLSENHFRKYHYLSILQEQNYEKFNSYIDKSTEVNKLIDDFKKDYEKLNRAYFKNYRENILINLREPLIARINLLFDASVSKLMALLAGFSTLISSRTLISHYVFKKSEFIETASKSENIAIKFRYRATPGYEKLRINGKKVSVAKDKDFCYFKLYLAQKEQILNMDQPSVFDKCYLSAEKLRPNNFDEAGRVDIIQIGKSEVFYVNLDFLRNNSDRLIYGINPIVEINIKDKLILVSGITELSKSLHEEI